MVLQPIGAADDGVAEMLDRERNGAPGGIWPEEEARIPNGTPSTAEFKADLALMLEEPSADDTRIVPVLDDSWIVENPWISRAPRSRRSASVAGDLSFRCFVTAAVGDKPKTGQPRTTDAELDQWARDVIKCVSDKSRPLYEQLDILWDVSDSTVKSHRLPLLRSTGRISGKGRSMTKEPHYRKEKTAG